MEFEKEIQKWNEIFSKNKNYKKQLKKIKKTQNEKVFFSDLKIINNAIVGKYGVGYNCINTITIKKIIDIFVQILGNKNNNYLLIASDGHPESTTIIKDIIELNNENIKFITFQNYEGFDKKFVSSITKKIKPFACLYISKNLFIKNFLEVNLYDGNGLKIKDQILKGIIQQISKDSTNIKRENENKISFLNNDSLIKLFIENISTLFPRTNSEKKIKIAISNRSNGVTQILSKLIGGQDYSYIINNKIKNKNIDISNIKYSNDKIIKKYFRKDIFFAIKKKSNLLVVFNKEGTQLFLFVINGAKVKYLNPDLISLIFLNNFYNDLVLNNKKINNLFIASNEIENKNINKLIQKYKIENKIIKNNDFVYDNYMLLFWNDYNQFVFGEKINDEFTIYHLLIKMIIIINYYNLQYNSINSLLNILEKMYGEFEYTSKYIFNFNLEQIKDKIQKMEQIDKYKNRIIISQNNNINDLETSICKINLANETVATIKFNVISQKTYIKLNYAKTHNLIKDFFVWKENKNFIKKISKLK